MVVDVAAEQAGTGDSLVNMAAYLEAMAAQHPELPALILAPTRNSTAARRDRRAYRQITYQELQAETAQLAAGLATLEIGRGTRVVLMVPPSAEFFALTFALFRLGAVPVFVDPGMGRKHLGQCLAEAAPEVFIGVWKAHVARVICRWAEATLRERIVIGSFGGWFGTSLQAIRERGTNAPQPCAATTADDVAAILFTSGSTGVPKGAVYTQGIFAAQVAMLRETFQIEPGEVDLCAFPLFALFAPALGMSAIVPRMDFTRPANVLPAAIVEPIQTWGATNLFGSPALLNTVARGYLREEARPSSSEPAAAAPIAPASTTPQKTIVADAAKMPTLRRVLSAGAPVSAAILAKMAQLLPPQTEIFTPYGATEALPVAVIGSQEILRETSQRTAQGAGVCIGRPISGVTVRIMRISDDPIPTWSTEWELPPGEIGEITVEGPMVTREYFQRPDLTALAKIVDPARGVVMHRMGDLGYFDDQGRLWFCGRKSQRVITADGTLFTEPIEGVFNAHPGVFRTALVGVPGPAGKLPVICVERETRPGRNLSDQQLVSELRRRSANSPQTAAIEHFLVHPAFPVDIRHNSKIFRERLAVWAADILQRRPG